MQTKISHYIYNLEHPIGGGSYGSILYKAYHEDNPKVELVLKVIRIDSLLSDKKLQQQVFRAIKILRQIKGTHIAEMIDVFKNENKLYIIMEYCDGGDLEGRLSRQKTLSEEEACKILKQIALAFVEIDKKDIVNTEGQKVIVMHRSINPHHIMFKGDILKLVDFGFAKVIADADQNVESLHTLHGFDEYASPQILNFDPYSSKCDIWSAGKLFYRMLFGGIPWDGRSKNELYKNIKCKPLLFPKQVSKKNQELLRKMLSIDEASRPTWKEIYDALP